MSQAISAASVGNVPDPHIGSTRTAPLPSPRAAITSLSQPDSSRRPAASVSFIAALCIGASSSSRTCRYPLRCKLPPECKHLYKSTSATYSSSSSNDAVVSPPLLPPQYLLLPPPTRLPLITTTKGTSASSTSTLGLSPSSRRSLTASTSAFFTVNAVK